MNLSQIRSSERSLLPNNISINSKTTLIPQENLPTSKYLNIKIELKNPRNIKTKEMINKDLQEFLSNNRKLKPPTHRDKTQSNQRQQNLSCDFKASSPNKLPPISKGRIAVSIKKKQICPHKCLLPKPSKKHLKADTSRNFAPLSPVSVRCRYNFLPHKLIRSQKNSKFALSDKAKKSGGKDFLTSRPLKNALVSQKYAMNQLRKDIQGPMKLPPVSECLDLNILKYNISKRNKNISAFSM
ncbi:unnamed protein product [Moneuplotes crassus]|uniref:Uncharacterized protein n=1 Tax=Euplotes crassus TaxID=5936 RepID=A0AAD1XJA9_EUPCR|nr:unnamed protein product [Moneuplotes crassus]